MLREDPGVSVGDTGAGEPSLVTAVGEAREVGAEELYSVVDVAYVVLSAERVKSDEMACECLAEPEAHIGLGEPVFPFMAVDSPGVDVA